MGKDNTERYDRFSKAYKTAYFDMSSAEERKKKMDAEWREKWKYSDDVVAFEARLMELKSKRESKSIFSAFSQSKKKKIKLNPGTSTVESQSSSTTVRPPEQAWDAEAPSSSVPDEPIICVDDEPEPEESNIENPGKSSHNRPAQETMEKEITVLHNKIDALEKIRDSGFATEENLKQFKTSRLELTNAKSTLKKKIDNARRQKIFRQKKSDLLKTMTSESEAAAEKLKSVTRDGPGRPPIEDSFPQLHEAIVKIASSIAGADGKRRTDILEACHTLDDLRAALLKEGYNLSRSALYYRLIPRKSNSTEGKKHVRTVPVKIRRSKNNIRARHQDANFTFSIKHYLKQVASFFGNKNAFVLSVDDKAKVPIGVTAAKYQSPLIMHMTYEIRLPDHDFVKASKHKLTPSVYAGCEIKSASAKSQEEITYSGPTYIAIRSCKHDSSTAYSHGYDFNQLVEIPEFQPILKTSKGALKPVGMMFVDGGPDENPRFPKTIDVYCQHFKRYDLDALLVLTHAPGMSAYNYVERKMAPLSKELAGLVIPHDSCGTHLDSQQRTTDDELERANFRKAGEILGEVWSNVVIDGHPVVTAYVESKELEPSPPTELWLSTHVQTSQYFLQIIKCEDLTCCGKMRSAWKTVFPKRFLPPPAVLQKSEEGPVVPKPSMVKSTDHFADLWQRLALTAMQPITVPFDNFCPSVQKDLEKRQCKGCRSYFASAAAVDRHVKGKGCKSSLLIPVARPAISMEVIENDEEENGTDNEAMPVISIDDILNASPFIEVVIGQDDDEDES